MNFRGLQKQDRPKKLDIRIAYYLRRKFFLSSAYTEKLFCFISEEIRAGAMIKRIRIFNFALAKEWGITVSNAADLANRADLLAFEGYIDQEGKLYFADRRQFTGLRSRAITAG